MRCPVCQSCETQVVDSRDAGDGIRRRRLCSSCQHRFTTYERAEQPIITVAKRGGDMQRFSLEKLRRSIAIPCKNRPVTSAQLDEVARSIERSLFARSDETITSHELGLMVRDQLRQLDPIAYVRFTSVHDAFNRIEQFQEVVNQLPPTK